MDFVIIIIMMAAFLIAIMANRSESVANIDCKLHEWTVDHNGEYFCRACKKSPGQITTDYDKPY